MEELFNRTAYDRLPASIRALPKETQTVCVFLRLRKTEEQIACETGFPAETVSVLADEVRRTLIIEGKYDLISEPAFTQYDENIGAQALPGGIVPEERMMLDKFIEELANAVSSMTEREKKILHLYFQERMSVNDIADFLDKTESAPVGAPLGPSVLAEVENSVKNLLDKLSGSVSFGPGGLTVKRLKDILNETGVGA